MDPEVHEWDVEPVLATAAASNAAQDRVQTGGSSLRCSLLQNSANDPAKQGSSCSRHGSGFCSAVGPRKRALPLTELNAFTRVSAFAGFSVTRLCREENAEEERAGGGLGIARKKS